MKVFIDLGAYDGDSLAVALKEYKDFDWFYAFEPFRKNFKILKKKFGNRKKIILCNSAVDIRLRNNIKLYLHDNIKKRPSSSDSNSLCIKNLNVSKGKFQSTNAINFSKFIFDNFNISDKIVLKIDIEGKEYDILEKMIKDGSIKYIDKIFCEWHYPLINLSEKEHKRFIKKLQKLGFDITGDSEYDEF